MNNLYGYPFRIYFELFAGEHPSEKIYSVQVNDWQAFVGTDLPVAAVVQVEDQALEDHIAHLKVVPTDLLVEFLESKGIEVPDEFYVQPLAFDWSDSAEYVEDEYYAEEEAPKNSNKTKAILAALVAAVALLN